jgi:hypothetical protein
MATPLVFSSEYIRYKIEMNENAVPASVVIVFTDTVAALYNSTYGLTVANIRGKLLLYAPDGTVLVDGTTAIINGNTSIWAHTISSPALDADNNIQRGSYTGTYSVSTDGGVSYAAHYVSIDLEYVYAVPSAVITFDPNIPASTLFVTDATSYNALNSAGDTVIPTKTYNMTTQYPMKSDGTRWSAAHTAATVSYTIGPSIYTRVWETSIATTVKYLMDVWADGSEQLTVNDLIEGSNKIDIHVPYAIGQYYASMVALQSKYDSLTYNYQEQARLREIQNQINDNYRLYEVALEAGEDWTPYAQNIQDLLESTGTLVPYDEDISVIIAAVSGGGTGASGFSGYSGDPAGGSGFSGYSGFSAFSGYSGEAATVAYNIITATVTPVGTDAGQSPKDLYSYTMAGGTLAETGDNVELNVALYLGENSRGKTIDLYFGGTKIDTFYTDSTVTATDKYINAFMRITRVDGSNQNVETEFLRAGLPGSTNGLLQTATTKTLSADQEIKVVGTNEESFANDIVMNQFVVKINQITPAP